jgi:signal transduction histidine kinase
VTDDGRGAASDEPAAAGLGIAGMRSRVQALGGALHAGPAGAGFVVRATIPLGADR